MALLKIKKLEHGTKLYIITTPIGFICSVKLTDEGIIKKLSLLENKVNDGHHLYMDNSYSNFDIAKKGNSDITPQDVKKEKLVI